MRERHLPTLRPGLAVGLGAGLQLAIVFAVSLAGLAGLIGWLQNVHVITANGMFKSIQAEPWMRDFAHARAPLCALYSALTQS